MSGNTEKFTGSRKSAKTSTMASSTKPTLDDTSTVPETKAERNKRNKLKKENAKKVHEAVDDDKVAAADSKAERNKRKHDNARKAKADRKKQAFDEKDFIEKAQALTIKEKEDELVRVLIRYDVTDTDEDEESSVTLSNRDSMSEPEHCEAKNENDNLTIPDTPPGLLFTFKSSPGKGVGAFANKNIKQGTEILVEEAIMQGMVQWIYKEALFKVLSPEKQDRILVLHSRCNCESKSAPCLETPLMKVWGVNAFETDKSGPILFDIASRFNHDCRPNVARGFSKEDYIVFCAARDIDKGEELTVNYILRPGSRKERKAEFRDRFGFSCSCDCCQGKRLFVNSDIIKVTLPIGVETKSIPLGKVTVEELEAQVKVATWFEEISKLFVVIQVSLYEFIKQLVQAQDERVGSRAAREACTVEALDAMDAGLKANNPFGFDDAFFDNYRARTKQSLKDTTERNYLQIILSLALARRDELKATAEE